MGKLYRLYLYRPLMRFAHRFNWHHMTVCYVEGDIMDWCQWCGVRQVRPGTMKPGRHFRYGGCGEIDEHDKYGRTIERD